MNIPSFFNLSSLSLKAIKYYVFLVLSLILIGISLYAFVLSVQEFITLVLPLSVFVVTFVAGIALLLNVSPTFRYYFIWAKHRVPSLFGYYNSWRLFWREKRIAKRNKVKPVREQSKVKPYSKAKKASRQTKEDEETL